MADSVDLVKVESAARVPDLYERKYMPGEGLVLYRGKSRAPWQFHALYGGILTTVIGTTVAASAYLATALTVPFLLLLWLLFTILRVTVSSGRLSIQYGLFGPDIPIADIESATAVRYDWKRYGGWGIKRGPKGEWMYNMPGDGGNAVRVVWLDRKRGGKRRITMIGSRDAQELAAQINQARGTGLALEGP